MRAANGVLIAVGALASIAAASCGDDEDASSAGSGATAGAAGSAGAVGAAGSSGSAGSDPGRDAATGTKLSFRKLTLSTDFYCEGATFGDFDRDGVKDVVSGPYWYRGPDFQQKSELYPPIIADVQAYSDNFFAFT